VARFDRLARLAQRTSGRVWGESATLTIGGEEYSIRGEFDSATAREEVLSDGPAVIETPTQICVQREQFDDAAITVDVDTVTVRGITYTITEARPNGVGALILILRR
jgi:hypothetical protein